ncbi:MAG: AI-2E family transporter [Firmicutes bacterium]|nr:AI-2E family transporter [Bacillota bacterium]
MQGRLKMAIGLVLLYVIITFIRNMIEPKLVGQTLGLHPVLMLVSIYLGVTLLGPLGIFILPLTLIVIRNLNDGGYIHLYNSAYMPHAEAPSAAEKAAGLAAEKVEAVIQKAKKDTGDE